MGYCSICSGGWIGAKQVLQTWVVLNGFRYLYDLVCQYSRIRMMSRRVVYCNIAYFPTIQDVAPQDTYYLCVEDVSIVGITAAGCDIVSPHHGNLPIA